MLPSVPAPLAPHFPHLVDRLGAPLDYLRIPAGIASGEHRGNRLDPGLKLLIRHRLTAPECSTFNSRGTRSAQIFMYAAGCILRTFSMAWRPCRRKSSANVQMKSALNALRDPSKVPRRRLCRLELHLIHRRLCVRGRYGRLHCEYGSRLQAQSAGRQ
jgi:hypothetical protein